MNWNPHFRRAATIETGSAPIPKPSRPRLRALIDQATSDSVDESDEHAGLLSVIREEVACPFPARLGGEDVECLRLEFPRNGYGLNAVCRTRAGKTQIVDVGRIEWVDPRPDGHEWIEAYFAWRDLLDN